MGLFGRKKYGSVDAVGHTTIRVAEPEGCETIIDLASLQWLSFLQVGDESTNVYEGWWLLGWRNVGIAVLIECGAIDPLLRDGMFADSIQQVTDKSLIFTSTRPTVLSGHAAKHGIVHLSADEAARLRNMGTHESASSVDDFPKIL